MTIHTTPRSERASPADALTVLLAAVGFGLVLLVVAPALDVPDHVDQISVDNPHPWPVHVAASQPGGGGWAGVGPVDQGDERTFQTVIDQGDQWVFRFSYAGHHTDLRVTRARLEGDSWHVTVPDDLAHQLRDAGIPEAPRH